MQKRRVSTRHIQNHTSGSELEAVLQCSSLVEHELIWSAVRILEEVSHALELDCDTGIVLEERWLSITLSDHE